MSGRIKCLLLVCLLVVFVLTMSTTTVFAKSNDITDLEDFLDSTMKDKMEKYHIPNATVSVVKDGQSVYKKGFGFADIENNVPVNADTTLFRIGSTSKLITWTAVMQLVEEGKLDLNKDINEYLDFKISPKIINLPKKTTVEPITLAHLMTHTAGFEDNSDAIFRLSPEELVPLNEYIKEYMPARIFPAGEVAAYSNYGTALAGYIVERVSGVPFSEYAEENIFKTLKMDKSTFSQSPAADLLVDMAKPYRFVDGSYLKGGFEYLLPAPAGSMSTTSSDMANFMIAHLNGGTYNEGQILREETLTEMHKQHFSYDSDLGGMALGFMDGEFNNKRVLFHGGSTMLFSTGLYLVPEENLGIFISYSGGNNFLHSEVFQELMDIFYPVKVENAAVPDEGSRESAKKFVGEYQQNRKSVTTDEKINSILSGGSIDVGVDKEGYLTVTNAGETNKFVEIQSGVFQNLREGRTQDYFGPFHKIIFKTDPNGRIMLTTDGPMTYSRAPFYSTMSFTALTLIIILLITISSLFYWIIIKLIRLFKKKSPEAPGLSNIAQWIGICASITILITFAGILSSGNVDPVYLLPQDAYSSVTGKSLLDFAPILLLIFSISLATFTAIVWKKGFWRSLARIQYNLFTLAVLGLTWLFYYWNLF